jgi:hypothetical protein
MLGAADGTPPPNVGAHLVPWIDAAFCSGALAADGALLVRLRATAGSSNVQVVESELRIP